jgi:radical SAM family uncharacterized protein/radical SAM-linked protein
MNAPSETLMNNDRQTPVPVSIDHILPLVANPGRYVPIERNLIRKDWTPDRVKVALAFPEVYELGVTHLGLRLLYHIVNTREDALAERAYCPWIDMEEQMRRRDIAMFSHESRMPLSAFDIVGFSLAYELTFTNVLTMLDLAGIPLLSADRGDDVPLILGGGSTVGNPEPIADFFDAILIGDGEDAMRDIVDVVKEMRGRPRADLLTALTHVEGVYVPTFYTPTYREDGGIESITTTADVPYPVKKRIVPELRLSDFPENPIVPITEATQDRLAVEVLRGCTQGCRFCQAGYYYRPVRERTPEDIVTILDKGVQTGGWDEVGLLSLSTSDHSRIEEIVTRLGKVFEDRNVEIALPSLRADTFSIQLAESAGALSKSGFTFAPETGTQRLRNVINKNLTDADLLKSVRVLFEKEVNLVKLYFMIGLPTETEEDLMGIIDLCNRVMQMGKEFGKGVRVNASIGNYVPKSFTPFQWQPFAGEEALREKLTFLKRNMRDRKVKLRWTDGTISWLESVFSRGDRRSGRAILEAWNNGARFDGWTEQFDINRWRAAFETTGVDTSVYTREKALDEALPWDHIDIGVTKKFLEQEWHRAEKGEITTDCRTGQCNGCGIPGMPNDNLITADLPKHTVEAELVDRHRDKEGEEKQGRGLLYRVGYSVDGPFRFVGHNDMIRVMHRTLEVAGIPFVTTGKYNPRPKLGFGPPLPMSCTSAGEYMDLILRREVPDLMERLNDAINPELRIISVQLVEGKVESLASIIHTAGYDLRMPPDLITPERVDEIMRGLVTAESFKVTRTRKGKERVTDLRKAIVAASARMDGDDTVVSLRVNLSDPDGNTANPALILSGLFEFDEEQAARTVLHRTELYDGEGRPLSELMKVSRRRKVTVHGRSFEFTRFLDT